MMRLLEICRSDYAGIRERTEKHSTTGNDLYCSTQTFFPLAHFSRTGANNLAYDECSHKKLFRAIIYLRWGYMLT